MVLSGVAGAGGRGARRGWQGGTAERNPSIDSRGRFGVGRPARRSPRPSRRAQMQIGVVGLGRMGANIARRLMRHGHSCVVFDRDSAPGQALAAEGARPATSLAELAGALVAPRAVWLMLPAGQITETAVAELARLLERGDVVIDGGNSFWKDDVRRGRALAEKGLHYLDVGTSGGVWGLERGYCLMIGGDAATVERLDPIFAALSPGRGAIPRTPK